MRPSINFRQPTPSTWLRLCQHFAENIPLSSDTIDTRRKTGSKISSETPRKTESATGGFKPQVQQRIVKSRHELSGGEPWKRWKTKNVSHFPHRHGYGYLYEFIHEICCTWNLYVPPPGGCSSLFVRHDILQRTHNRLLKYKRDASRKDKTREKPPWSLGIFRGIYSVLSLKFAS